MSNHETIEIIRGIIADAKFAMLTTQCDKGHLHACPMTTQKTDDQPHKLWFLMNKGSDAVKHMQTHPQVNLAYQDGGDYLSISGTATLLEDQAKIDVLWSDAYEAFFDGAHDTDIQLVCIEANSAQYWKSGGTVNSAFQLAKAALTGDKAADDLGETRSIDL